MQELKMVDECYEYLVKMNTYASVIREVPFLSRCIDMVIITNDNEMITIEFKIKDWRHALEQVKNHKLGADRAYICLPIKTPSINLINALSEENVGLYLYNPDEIQIMREYLPAPKNHDKVDKFSSMLFNKAFNIKNLEIS
ncbi:MAG: hypothetical protein WCY62_06660 [Clostridia bacterium]|jgi:hypothetical protein